MTEPQQTLGQASLRIARPSRDLAAAERFWTRGVGLSRLFRHHGSGKPGDHSLLMLGMAEATWHLELVHDDGNPTVPSPTPEDLIVLYLERHIPEELTARIEGNGGTRVAAHNPYWDEWGVTFVDPDGYRLVLSTRSWNNAEALGM